MYNKRYMINKKPILTIVVLVVVAGFAVWYLFFTKSKEGAVKTAEEVSEKVPEIQTNAGENVPEVNPLDRSNPFKYNNPLR